jgi:O-antigen ligase
MIAWLAAVLYVCSTQKFWLRDPLLTNSGPQGIVEAVLIGGAFLVVLASAIRAKTVRKPSGPVLYLAFFGLFALASSAFSFWPPLSIVKGILYLLVIGLAWLASSLWGPWQFLRSIYFTYIGLVVIGVIVGITAGNSFPLFAIDAYSGRTRMTIFATFPGTLGEVAAMMVILGRLIPGGVPIYCQTLLVLINILAAGKTSTATLFAVLLISFLISRRSRQSWIKTGRMICITALAVLFAAVISILASDHGLTSLQSGFEELYGNRLSEEASTLDGRSELWEAALPAVQRCLWLGFGFDGARSFLLEAIPWSGQSHNGFLELILTSGLFGTGLFMLGWLECILISFQCTTELRNRILSLHLLIGITSFTSIIFTVPSYFGVLLFVCCGYIPNPRYLSSYSSKPEHAIDNAEKAY